MPVRQARLPRNRRFGLGRTPYIHGEAGAETCFDAFRQVQSRRADPAGGYSRSAGAGRRACHRSHGNRRAYARQGHGRAHQPLQSRPHRAGWDAGRGQGLYYVAAQERHQQIFTATRE